jgi:PIN domain
MTDNTILEHLQTKYVFIDTEAFRRARFDWKGRMLSKLVELAKQGHLRLLTTEVVMGEVRSQLREALAEAAASMKKHESVLRQVGAIEALATVTGANTALAALHSAFDAFLKDTNSINVPLGADLNSLFANYFARRPPFSDKKKSEFPDAITIASLLAWCAKRNSTAYVVSGDPDLKACCSSSGPLFYAASVGDIVSQAMVSKELHEALERALTKDEQLNSRLANQITGMELASAHVTFQSSEINVSGTILYVSNISIYLVNVLGHEGSTFTCEIEFEAELSLDLDVKIRRLYDNEDTEGRPDSYSVSTSIYRIFYAEVMATFERGPPQALSIDAVDVSGSAVELSNRDIDDLLH